MKSPLPWLKTGLASLFLLGLLSGCVVSNPQVVKVVPPAVLYQQTESPEFSGSTNQDLFLYSRSLKAGLQECNDDKAAIELYIRSYDAAGTKQK